MTSAENSVLEPPNLKTFKRERSISINLLSPVVNCPCRTSLRMRRSFMR